MNIKQTILLPIFIVLFFVSYFAQEKAFNNDVIRDFKVDKTKPNIYLTFEKFGEIKSKSSDISERSAFLKFHNNTIFPIAIDANFDTRLIQSEKLSLSDGTAVKTIPNNSVVEVCFDVDAIPYTTSIETKSRNGKKGIIQGIQLKKENPAENDKTTCFWRNGWQSDEFGNGERIWIKPNQSFLFKVPNDYIKDNLKISTLFNYEWEFNDGKLNFDEPKHRVYFYSSGIPK